jgi:hypothetical protein
MRLLYFDETKKANRVLRYAANFKSPFVDEQHGEAVLQEIIFENGFLFVPRNNPALQEFLKYHPGLGRVYTEVDPEAEAEREMEKIDREADAIIAAKRLSMEQAESVFRVLFGKDPESYQSAVILRDIKVFARNNPSEFLLKIEDPGLGAQSEVRAMFDNKILAFRNGVADVHYNLKDNKKRMVTVPKGHDPYREVQAYFETDEGLKIREVLKAAMGEL